MKKIIAILFFCGIMTCGNAQNIIQITNNGSQNTATDCGFKINGICSSEDIGGVSLENISRQDLGGGRFQMVLHVPILKTITISLLRF